MDGANSANRRIDLRSDTVTRPTPAMRRAMAEAEVGDDVHGEDPTVNRLEARVAELLGLEAGLFLSSGTQSNLAALMAHCGRGEGYLTGESYHTVASEAGGAAVLGSIVPILLPVGADGTVDPARFRAAIRPEDFHRPIPRLIALENTMSGRIMPAGYVQEVAALAREHDLKLHLDGARLLNAAVATGSAPDALAAGADSVSLCLSKGLGAPAGTVLAGPRDFIRRARRARKMLGGAMRQSGVLAAAGLHALDAHVARLADDHALAEALGRRLAGVVEVLRVSTNMVHARLPGGQALRDHLAARNIVIAAPGPETRMVLHLDIEPADIERVGRAFESFYEQAGAAHA